MNPEFQDIGQKIDAALGNVDVAECRALLGLTDLPHGEFMARLEDSGADVERLMVSAIAMSVTQSRQVDLLQQLLENQQVALDAASDAMKRLQKQLYRAAGRPETELGTSSSHVDALKDMIERVEKRD